MTVIVDVYRKGQSIWLDFLSRALVQGGGLRDLVEMGVRGVTSNPTIFHKAISEGDEYDHALAELLRADPGARTEDLGRWLMVEDVQRAADLLRGVYEQSRGRDGFVSLEVPPDLAYDTEGTVEAARELWQQVDRPNLMIKVPGTREGLPAITRLLAEGVNVNVTLLFSVRRYEEVVEAFLEGVARHPRPERLASVASFFVSRVDTKVDARLEAMDSEEARRLVGRIAIANAKVAYQRYLALKQTPAFRAQLQRGAAPQRLLWASTGMKRPDRSPILYVQELIGPETVATLPPQTLDAFVAQGEARETLTAGVEGAQRDLEALAGLGIDLEAICRELEAEGVQAFADSWRALHQALEEKRARLLEEAGAETGEGEAPATETGAAGAQEGAQEPGREAGAAS
ncbi:MAG: transaldolase [Gammaproteobacteria bacterium]|nr:MAG: transaldolase [Gammaproteobacteria bacterium]